MLLRYYKIFKELNPKIRIGAIFTYAANASQDDEQTGMNQGFANSKVPADELQAIMDDYNAMFGTAFTTDNFSAYYDDVNERMKKRRKDMQPLDLLLVVGMFLAGFDAKRLNTLYVDKNLEYHGLLQAFSRTNRVLNEKNVSAKSYVSAISRQMWMPQSNSSATTNPMSILSANHLRKSARS